MLEITIPLFGICLITILVLHIHNICEMFYILNDELSVYEYWEFIESYNIWMYITYWASLVLAIVNAALILH